MNSVQQSIQQPPFSNGQPSFSIGIDPGQQTGFAVYDIQNKTFRFLMTLSFWRAYYYARQFSPLLVSRVVIELPDSKHVWHKPGSSIQAIQKQGVNVGGVIREAQLLAEGIRDLGHNVQTVNPRGKTTKEKFQQITGWTGITNQHMRDAGILCWGR